MEEGWGIGRTFQAWRCRCRATGKGLMLVGAWLAERLVARIAQWSTDPRGPNCKCLVKLFEGRAT